LALSLLRLNLTPWLVNWSILIIKSDISLIQTHLFAWDQCPRSLIRQDCVSQPHEAKK